MLCRTINAMKEKQWLKFWGENKVKKAVKDRKLQTQRPDLSNIIQKKSSLQIEKMRFVAAVVVFFFLNENDCHVSGFI